MERLLTEAEENVTFSSILKEKVYRRSLLALVPSLTLGIMGGAVLPVAWAFSITGVMCGILTMVVVALANVYTCELLLKQAFVTGTYDYESLAFAIGGPVWKLLTELSIVILLFGSIMAQIAQIGEVASSGLAFIDDNLEHSVPWLVGSSGRMLMVLSTVAIIAPVCAVKQFRQLEHAGVAGTAIVIWLLVTTVIKSSIKDLPEINKSFDLLGFDSIGNFTQSIQIFGFAFYAQPFMMPLLKEVPEGLKGMMTVSYSTRIVVLINAFFIYFFVGFFAAALYGSKTEQNILKNELLKGDAGYWQAILNLAMAIYLCLSIPPMEFPTRHTIDGWLSKEILKGYPNARQAILTALVLLPALGIALIVPKGSAKVLVVTGATGVCLVSYLIPILNHFLLYFKTSPSQLSRSTAFKRPPTDLEMVNMARSRRLYADPDTISTPTYYVYIKAPEPGIANQMLRSIKYVIRPGLVLIIGIFCSVAALTTLPKA